MAFPWWKDLSWLGSWKPFCVSFFDVKKIFTRERFTDQVSASVIIFFRFIAVWGIGVVALASPNGHDLAKFIKNNGTVAATPYADSAHWSLETIWYLTVWEFCWQFVASMLQLCLPIHMIYVLVDVLGLAGISAGWSQSVKYIPQNETCTANGSTWLAPADGGLNLFAAIGQVANRSATDVCYTFADVKENQKVTLVMIAIVVALALWLLLPPEHPLSIPHVCVYILLPIGWFFRELLIHLSFTFHYLSHKIGRTRNSAPPIKLKDYAIGLSALPPRDDVKISERNVERLLGIEHILEAICQDLCYRDVVNLSRSSRGIHDLVMPPGDLAIRVEKLRSWTCGGDEWERGTCFTCNRRVCVKCDVRDSFVSTDVAHATRCKPACTWCYYTKVIRDRAQTTARRACRGHDNGSVRTSTQYLCSICEEGFQTRQDIEEMDKLKQKGGTSVSVQAVDHRKEVESKVRARLGLMALIDAKNENCRFCGSRFTWIRRRWWHCSACQMECRDGIHPKHLSRRKREPLNGDV